MPQQGCDRTRKGLDPGSEHLPDQLAVNDIACTDPACPGVETVILVMEPGQNARCEVS